MENIDLLEKGFFIFIEIAFRWFRKNSIFCRMENEFIKIYKMYKHHIVSFKNTI